MSHRQNEESGPAFDFTNPLHVAVRLTELGSEIRLTDQKVSLGLQSVFDQLASLNGSLRDVERGVQAVANQQQEIHSHATGLENLSKIIERHIQQQDERWEKHEGENKTVSDRVNIWRGIVIAGCILVGAVVSLSAYIVQSGFSDAAKARGQIEARLDRLEARP